jgi:hypothetical protein
MVILAACPGALTGDELAYLSTVRRDLGHYQQTKNLLVSYSPKALGFF